MKKILAVMLAVLMTLSCMSVVALAAPAEQTYGNLSLSAGGITNGAATVTNVKPGEEYTLTGSPNGDGKWIQITGGNGAVWDKTSELPAGSVIETTKVIIDNVTYEGDEILTDARYYTVPANQTVSVTFYVDDANDPPFRNNLKDYEYEKPESISITFKFTLPAVTGVSLNKETTTLAVGGSETLSATVAPEGAGNKNVTWASDNEEVATVVDGVVTAVAAGTANIIVTTEDGSFTDTCAVTVIADAVDATAISIPEKLNLGVGDTETLTATLTPENATTAVTWASSNEAVATVDESGKVTAVAPGKATITATAGEGVTDICAVNVNDSFGTIGLYVSAGNPDHAPNVTVDIVGNGDYTLSIDGHTGAEDWIIVKGTGSGKTTNLPAGTVITTKSMTINGNPITLSNLSSHVANYPIGNDKVVEIMYYLTPNFSFIPGFGNHIGEEYTMGSAESVEVTFTVTLPKTELNATIAAPAVDSAVANLPTTVSSLNGSEIKWTAPEKEVLEDGDELTADVTWVAEGDLTNEIALTINGQAVNGTYDASTNKTTYTANITFTVKKDALNRVTGWFYTSEKYHAMLIGRAIISLPHEFTADGTCKYCHCEGTSDAPTVEVEKVYAKLGLSVGDMSILNAVEITGNGTYSVTAKPNGGEKWIQLASDTGDLWNKNTDLPAGTKIETTKVIIDGVEYTGDKIADKARNFTVPFGGAVEINYFADHWALGGFSNNLTGFEFYVANEITVEFTVTLP